MAISTPTDRFVSVGAVRARYWTAGNSGPPLILLHGIGGSVEAWHKSMAALGQHHRVYAVDFPGCGRSDRSTASLRPHFLTGLATFVARFMDSMGIERAILVGSSLGGAVALECAYRFPQRVEALALISSAGFGADINLALRLSSLPGIGELLTRPNREGAAAGLQACVLDPSIVTDAEIETAYTLSTLPGAQQAFLGILRAHCNFFGVHRAELQRIWSYLPALRLPVLIIWGKQDGILPVGQAQRAASMLANVRIELVDRCGHLPAVEQPEIFNRLLLDFAAAPAAYVALAPAAHHVVAAPARSPLRERLQTLSGHMRERPRPTLRQLGYLAAGCTVSLAAVTVARRQGAAPSTWRKAVSEPA